MPEVSIITALYNCVHLTEKYVETVIETMGDFDWELILVDDCSTDSTPDLLAQLQLNPRIRIHQNETNRGYAANNNYGASIAKSPLLAFLNNDLELTPNWFEEMYKAYKESENVGIVGNIQINPQTKLLDHAGVFFGLDGMPRQARKNRRKIPSSAVSEWFAVTAACMLVSKKDFLSVGGFDEAYRNGFEDIDLCVKLKELGKKHYVANRSRIYHHVSVSPGRHKNNDKNSDIFEKRWTSITKTWGQQDWAPEYLERYRRHWWKFNFSKLCQALKMIVADRKCRNLNYRS